MISSKVLVPPLIFYQQVLDLHFLLSQDDLELKFSYTVFKNEEVFLFSSACLKIPKEAD